MNTMHEDYKAIIARISTAAQHKNRLLMLV